jgi:hypothetical protein
LQHLVQSPSLDQVIFARCEVNHDAAATFWRYTHNIFLKTWQMVERERLPGFKAFEVSV